jgi:hypothetical protein
MLAPPRGDTPPVPFQLRRTDTFLLNGRPASRQAAMAPGHHVLVTEIHHTHKRRQLAGRTEIPGRVEGRLAGNNEQGLTLLSPDADRKTRRLVTVDPDARIEIDGVEAPLQALTNGLRVAVFPAAPRTLYLDLNPLASASIEELREAMKGLNWSRAHAAAKTLLGHAWEKPEAYLETICATLEDPRSRRCRPALLDGLWSLPEAVRDAQAKRVLDSAVNTLRTSGYGMRDSVAIIERYADKLDPEQRSSMTALLDSGFARPHREWVKRLRAALTPKQNDQAAP